MDKMKSQMKLNPRTEQTPGLLCELIIPLKINFISTGQSKIGVDFNQII